MRHRILFVCHGNICRSVSAQYIFQDMVNRRGLAGEFVIDSAATSTEEIGNAIYPPMKAALERRGVTDCWRRHWPKVYDRGIRFQKAQRNDLNGGSVMWFVFALLSAVFAALTSILAKIGIEGVNSNLATAIRTMVVLAMAWGMVFLTHAQSGIGSISRKSWLFLILSGLATGASWLCYYRALQVGEASKVVPIDKLSVVITLVLAFLLLHEEVSVKDVVGCVLIGAGTLMMVL